MAITYQSAGTISYTTTTTLAMTYPASISVGDGLVMFVHFKSFIANGGSVTTPSGWTLITSLIAAGGYGSGSGTDLGNTNMYAYSRTADGSEANFNVTSASPSVVWGQILRLSCTGTSWLFAGATGSDTSAGNVSVTFGSDPGVTSGDYVLGAFGAASHLATYSAEAITATNATVGSVTEVSEPSTATGNHLGGFVARAAITAGTATAAPVMTATTGGTTTNARGPSIFVRLREVAPPFIAEPNPPIRQAVNRSYLY